MRDDEPRPVWMSLLITLICVCFCVCVLLLQDLLQLQNCVCVCVCVCVITAGPITKLCAWGGTREEPGT
jgi:hypothetical protein